MTEGEMLETQTDLGSRIAPHRAGPPGHLPRAAGTRLGQESDRLPNRPPRRLGHGRPGSEAAGTMRGVVGGLTREALAERAGVHVGFVDRLVELGILVPPETGSLFTEGELRRGRWVRGLEDGGLTIEGIG